MKLVLVTFLCVMFASSALGKVDIIGAVRGTGGKVLGVETAIGMYASKASRSHVGSILQTLTEREVVAISKLNLAQFTGIRKLSKDEIDGHLVDFTEDQAYAILMLDKKEIDIVLELTDEQANALIVADRLLTTDE